VCDNVLELLAKGVGVLDGGAHTNIVVPPNAGLAT
jgi:hypothetical protein